ncbi:histidine phosphatase family protein [Fulvivirga sp. M361]|uniref:histidine phosphatase family protein n=1 Tax=Fulvivirga sp. M361 TaxID=2594266 RepID=UPI00117AF4B0|nr:phosphoglycerate mutase family protein [Fulvivirga sp. M361]TRX62175.1 histidine phosphatase family protein [Fulvivirga sp. M361]
MKLRYLLFVCSLFVFVSLTCVHGQTTVILLRHAEKDLESGSDPGLSEKGRQRAKELVRVLENVKIDAIYSTPFNRTKETVAPLAENQELDIEEYNPFKLEEITAMLMKSENKTFVFSGHSNTTPIFVNLLLGSQEYKQLNEADYDNLYIVTINKKGKSKVLELAYGEVSAF